VKPLTYFHNAFLVVLSLYMCLRTIYEAWAEGYSFWGTGLPKATEIGMANVTWLFYTSKFYEFIDTFIMLLKGNLRQVSYLHVYHHMTIPFIQWILACYSPGGENYWSQIINSWVHVVMYTYYFMASVLPKDPAVRKRWLWWGKYLTMMQISQFAANFSHGVYCLRGGSNYPLGIGRIYTWYMVTLLFFFGNFFLQKHVAPAGKKGASDISPQKKGA
jgi:elongation of very long chain fatty acids protein 4